MIALWGALLAPPLHAAELPLWLSQPCPHGGWGQLGASLALRQDTEIAESLWARVGCERPSGLRWGVELGLWPRRSLEALGPDTGYRAVVGELGASWWAGGAWSPGLGASLGLSRRQLLGPWSAADAIWVPTLGVEAGWIVPVGERLAVVPSLRGLADLRRMEVWVEGVPREVLSPFELGLGVSVMFPAPGDGQVGEGGL